MQLDGGRRPPSPPAGLGIHYRGGAVGGGWQWIGVVSYSKIVYNII